MSPRGPREVRAAPTVADIDAIAGQAEPVIRNLRITHAYHLLSRSLASRTDGHANWCTFAVWASKQVGRTIRQEDLTHALERALAASPEANAGIDLMVRALRWAFPGHAVVEQTVRTVIVRAARLDEVSDAAARGNLKVFAEIAREFARFLAEFAQDTVLDERRIADFCAALRPGKPPDGQDYLRRAFTRYHKAMFGTDEKERAELLLLANLEIGLHEQTRLQPEITAALEAPILDPRDLERRLLYLLLPDNPILKWPRLALLTVLGRRTPVRLAAEQLTERVRGLVRRAVTEHLMVLCLPDGGVLDLSEDLPATFPPQLAELVDLELRAFLARVDPSPDSVRDTAVRDWSDLPDRMHYITDLFRCYAQRADLLDPPFTADQVADFTAGRLPSGRL